MTPTEQNEELYRGLVEEAFSEGDLDAVDAVVAEGDIVVGRWTATGTHEGALEGVEPTGTEVTVMGLETYRAEDGRFVEDWAVFDVLGMLRQLGTVPEPEPSPRA